MPRIRTIKPNHVNDKELPKITLQAHLFWVLSWCFSDDEGVIENDPLLLKSQIFPRRTDIRIDQVEQWIDQLIKARFIIPFTHQGGGYLLHRTFKTHQKVDRPQESKIPKEVIRRTLDEYSTNDRPCIVKDSKGEEGVSPPDGVDIASEYDNLEKTVKTVTGFIRNKSPDFIEPYVDLWNFFAVKNKMAQVKAINSTRRKKLGVRLKEKEFDFVNILSKANQSQFILTKGNWFGFDWIIENESNYLKVLEGSYDKKGEEKEINPLNQQLLSQ